MAKKKTERKIVKQYHSEEHKCRVVEYSDGTIEKVGNVKETPNGIPMVTK